MAASKTRPWRVSWRLGEEFLVIYAKEHDKFWYFNILAEKINQYLFLFFEFQKFVGWQFWANKFLPYTDYVVWFLLKYGTLLLLRENIFAGNHVKLMPTFSFFLISSPSQIHNLSSSVANRQSAFQPTVLQTVQNVYSSSPYELYVPYYKR